MKNKGLSIFFGVLLGTTLLIDTVHCGRKTPSRRGGSSNSNSSPQRTAAPQTRTATTASSRPANSHSYSQSQQSQSDASKLTYGNNYNAPPRQPANNNLQQTGDQSNVGWKQNQAPNAPPAYSNNGPPPAYSQHPQSNSQPNFHEQPPAYQPQPGLGAGHVAPQYPVGGYQQPSYQQPGYHGAPGGGYAQQPGGYPQQPGGYPQQPGGYPMGQGGYQQPPVINNYAAQPGKSSSGMSGLQTALIAGVGGVALYGALKPSETKTIYINNGTNEAAPVAPAAAPVDNNVSSTPVPLAPMPGMPPADHMQQNQGAAPGMYPMQQAPGMYPMQQGPGMYPMQQGPGMYPMQQGPGAPMKVEHNGLVLDPVTNTMVNCTALMTMHQNNMMTPPPTIAPMMANTSEDSSSSMSASTMNPVVEPVTMTPIPAVCLQKHEPMNPMMSGPLLAPMPNQQEPQPMIPALTTNENNMNNSMDSSTGVPLAQYPSSPVMPPMGDHVQATSTMMSHDSSSMMNNGATSTSTMNSVQTPIVSAVKVDPGINNNTIPTGESQSAKISQDQASASLPLNTDGKSSGNLNKFSLISLVVPLIISKILIN